MIDNVVAVAEHTADELIRTDGREVRLGEDEELQLPFLLPEDGYSCDIIRGVPQGLQEFLQLLIETGKFLFLNFFGLYFLGFGFSCFMHQYMAPHVMGYLPERLFVQLALLFEIF